MTDASSHTDNYGKPFKHIRHRAIISCSRKDQVYLQEFQDHLAYYKQKWQLEVWDDTQIQPGTDWYKETNDALQSARVAVLLISSDFFADEKIMKDKLPLLLSAAQRNETIILCVILRPSAFEYSELAPFRTVNSLTEPLTKQDRVQRDEVWENVAGLLLKILKKSEDGTPDEPLLQEEFFPSISEDTSSHQTFTKLNLVNKQKVQGQPTTAMLPPCDVCIICAMDEEVEAFIHQVSHFCSVTFQPALGHQTGRHYRHTIISNNDGEPLSIYVTWPPRYGPEEMGLHLKSVLEELKPRFAAMVGICAGDKKKVALGDIIVAERAFRSDTGKMVVDTKGHRTQLYDTNTQGPDTSVLQYIRMFKAWETSVAVLQRPISLHQQRDWLLNTLLSTSRVDDIQEELLKQHAPDWRKIVDGLQNGTPRYLKADRSLLASAQVRELHFGKEDFPFQDPEYPERHIAPMASSSLVRSDNPFEDIRKPVYKTIAIDMEGATFYRTVADFPGLPALLVKGVSDYADSDKDDSYHKYAAAISSIYILRLIQEYVNNNQIRKISLGQR